MSAHEQSDLARRLGVYLDPGDDVPLFRQLVDRLWLEIITGTLEAGERLPTVRQLAIDLGIHPNTVGRAYTELELLGVLVKRPGHGTYVCLGPADQGEVARRRQLERLCREVVSQAEALGVSIDELVDTLTDLRAARRDARARRSS